jgi:hypothetical protein
MTESDRKSEDGRALWAQVREPVAEDLAAAAPEIDPMDLAAYLDGGLDEGAVARVEGRLAASPEALDLLIAAREALEAGTTPAPESLVHRAGALAGAPSDPAGGWLSRLLQALTPAGVPRRAVALGTAAAAYLLVSAAGFELGRAEFDYNAQIDRMVASEIAFSLDRSADDML